MLNQHRRFKFTGSNTRTFVRIWFGKHRYFLEREKHYIEKTIKQFSGIENIQTHVFVLVIWKRLLCKK